MLRRNPLGSTGGVAVLEAFLPPQAQQDSGTSGVSMHHMEARQHPHIPDDRPRGDSDIGDAHRGFPSEVEMEVACAGAGCAAAARASAEIESEATDGNSWLGSSTDNTGVAERAWFGKLRVLDLSQCNMQVSSPLHPPACPTRTSICTIATANALTPTWQGSEAELGIARVLTCLGPLEHLGLQGNLLGGHAAADCRHLSAALLRLSATSAASKASHALHPDPPAKP